MAALNTKPWCDGSNLPSLLGLVWTHHLNLFFTNVLNCLQSILFRSGNRASIRIQDFLDLICYTKCSLHEISLYLVLIIYNPVFTLAAMLYDQEGESHVQSWGRAEGLTQPEMPLHFPACWRPLVINLSVWVGQWARTSKRTAIIVKDTESCIEQEMKGAGIAPSTTHASD